MRPTVGEVEGDVEKLDIPEYPETQEQRQHPQLIHMGSHFHLSGIPPQYQEPNNISNKLSWECHTRNPS